MGRTLYVAAGGGGDVIGATMLHAVIGSSDRAQIATFSWDRLLVDPVPGPRNPTEFDRLQAIGRWNYRVTAATRTRPPAASSLPRLARELRADLYLLDPRAGTVGLARQLGELAEELQASSVCVVDIGGDILARGDEKTLRSPLADSLVVAALADHPLPVQLVVAGVGLDGELDPSYLLRRLAKLGARTCGAVRREAVLPLAEVFRWHLSEVSGLLATTAMGARGRAQMRAGRSVVELTEEATLLHRLDLQAVLSEASPAKALFGATSLDRAQDALVGLGAKSELEYERQKAAGSELADRVLGADALLGAVDSLADEATSDGVDLLTLRRVAEALGLTAEGFAANLGTLRRLRPLQYCPPVWVVNPEAWSMTLRFRGDTSDSPCIRSQPA